MQLIDGEHSVSALIRFVDEEYRKASTDAQKVQLSNTSSALVRYRITLRFLNELIAENQEQYPSSHKLSSLITRANRALAGCDPLV